MMRALGRFLTAKRNAFPRLYFLSDDEIMDLVSHAADYESVQRMMCKMFDGTDTFEFVMEVEREAAEALLARSGK